ncbi:MAG TPA: hypothetical protein VHG93_17890 [Longimicrobium sp.]|nr:hypothetical protein [Longimicrobium sp.]
MAESRNGGQIPDPKETDGTMDRRAFLSAAGLLGMGLAAGCGDARHGWNALVGSGPTFYSAVPNGASKALQLYNASPMARRLGTWLEGQGLQLQSGRSLFFDVPAVSTSSGITVEDRPTLIGESAYRSFHTDSFSTSNLTSTQLASLSGAERTNLAGEIGSLIRAGGCCCCCCCSCSSSNSCCSSSNGGVQGVASSRAFTTAAITFNDPTVQYAGPVRTYLSGMVGVQDNGEAFAVAMSGSNDPGMTIHSARLAFVDHDTGALRITASFTPADLRRLGPDALATQIFANA